MKNLKLIFLLIALFSGFVVISQIAINSVSSVADASAMLDVNSNTSGILIPRMTEAKRDEISSPATGLLIFQTDGTTGYYYNEGTSGSPNWEQLSNTWTKSGSNTYTTNSSDNVGIGTSSPTAKLEVEGTGVTRILVEANASGSPPHLALLHLYSNDFSSGQGVMMTSNDNYNWYIGVPHKGQGFSIGKDQIADSAGTNNSSLLFISNEGNVVIGDYPPDNSAVLTINSTDKGFLPPRMAAGDITSISSPVTGLTVYNTTSHKLAYYDGTQWKNYDGTSF